MRAGCCSLLRPECRRWIHPRRSPSRHRARHEADCGEECHGAEVGHRIEVRDAEQHRHDDLADGGRAGEADQHAEPRQRHSLPHYQLQNVCPRRTECRAHTDFLGPLGNAARQHSVDPGSREDQGHDGECPEQGQREPAFRRRCGDDMVAADSSSRSAQRN